MTEEMKATIAEKGMAVMDWVQATVSQGTELVKEEAPELVHEFFVWRTLHHTFFFICACLGFILAALSAKKVWAWVRKSAEPADDGIEYILACAATIPAIAALLAMSGHLYSLLLVTLVPRMYAVRFFLETAGKG